MFDLEDDWFDHEAVEALPQIRHAFELGRIDEMLREPWGNDMTISRIRTLIQQLSKP